MDGNGKVTWAQLGAMAGGMVTLVSVAVISGLYIGSIDSRVVAQGVLLATHIETDKINSAEIADLKNAIVDQKIATARLTSTLDNFRTTIEEGRRQREDGARSRLPQ